MSIWVKKEENVLLHLIKWNKKELTQTMESIIKNKNNNKIIEELERANKKSENEQGKKLFA